MGKGLGRWAGPGAAKGGVEARSGLKTDVVGRICLPLLSSFEPLKGETEVVVAFWQSHLDSETFSSKVGKADF